jgi:hypothetical protein
LFFFVYKIFISNIFASFICSASGSWVVNESPNASDRDDGRPPTERGKGRGRRRLAIWFGL